MVSIKVEKDKKVIPLQKCLQPVLGFSGEHGGHVIIIKTQNFLSFLCVVSLGVGVVNHGLFA